MWFVIVRTQQWQFVSTQWWSDVADQPWLVVCGCDCHSEVEAVILEILAVGGLIVTQLLMGTELMIIYPSLSGVVVNVVSLSLKLVEECDGGCSFKWPGEVVIILSFYDP